MELNPQGNPLYSLYKDTVQLEFDQKKHWYFANGEYVPSVTGVTKYLDKSGPLMYYAARKTVEYFKDQIKPGQMVDEVQLETIFREGLTQFRSHTHEAADIGSLIHEWIEKYIKNILMGVSETLETPLNARVKNGVQAFLDWEKQNKLVYLKSESKIYSKKYNYAGTCDLVAKVNGKLSIVDFKTGKGPYYEHVLQTAAYQQALQEELKWKFKERWLIHIDKNTGKFEAHKATLYKEDFKAFKALLDIYARHRLGILVPEKPKIQYEF